MAPLDELAQRLQRHLPERYELEREIGRGGMAVVYLARERHPSRRVAIKVLDPAVTVLDSRIFNGLRSIPADRARLTALTRSIWPPRGTGRALTVTRRRPASRAP